MTHTGTPSRGGKKRNTRKIQPRGIVPLNRSIAARERYTRKNLRNRNNEHFAIRHNGALRLELPSPRRRNNSFFNLGSIPPSFFSPQHSINPPPARPHYRPPNRNTLFSFQLPLQNTPGKKHALTSGNFASPRVFLQDVRGIPQNPLLRA
jgi:hypothetical protein